MSICIDLICPNIQSGTKTYNLNLLNFLRKKKFYEGKIYIFLTKNFSKNLNNLKNKKNIFFIKKPNFYSSPIMKIIWIQIIMPIEVLKLRVKKLFSPMNICPFILPIFGVDIVLGLHSNLPWVYFDLMPGSKFKNILIKFFMTISVKICKTLIVNSNFAKRELLKKINIDKKKIKVIYLGLIQKKIKNKYRIENLKYKKYFLSVLSCVKYHNIINMLKSYNQLLMEHKIEHCFVIVAQILDKNYFKEVQDFIKKNNLSSKVIFFSNLDTKYLYNLYRNCSLYIFTSYSEVFGYTTLEAMSLGAPVAVSKTSALPEINSDAAYYFNPYKPQALKKIMFNSTKKNLVKKKNIDQNLKRFKFVTQQEKVVNLLLK